MRLLRAVQGLRLVDLPRAEECCGFGGFFSVKFADLSGAMLNTKMESIEASGADVVTATDAVDKDIRVEGCLTGYWLVPSRT